MSDSVVRAVVCSACGGDARASVVCRQCGGAGIGVQSAQGFLVWLPLVDDFTVAFRAIRRRLRLGYHVALFFALFVLIALSVWGFVNVDDITSIFTVAFWVSGQWFVSSSLAAFLLGCYAVFHVRMYSNDEKVLPVWGLRENDIEHAYPSQAASGYSFDISPFFSKEAYDVVETAYRISKDLRRTEISPEALFAATLTVPAGGLFMARLGLQFPKIQQELARVLVDAAAGGEPPIGMSRETKRVLADAYVDSWDLRRKHVEPIEIFLQAFQASPRLQSLLDRAGFPSEHVVNVAEWIRLQERLREDYERFVALAALKPNTTMNRAMTAQQTQLLDRYSEDYTLMARNGHFSPLIGREAQMEALLQGIESGNRSVVLVGDFGVGKGALIEELARRMVTEDVPPALFDRRLVSVNIAHVIAGGDPGLASERLLTMLNEVALSGNVILAVQGIEALVGGAGGGPLDLAETFASELDKGYFIAIATTTPRAWTEYLERRSLGSKLVKVLVPSMDPEETLQTLMAKCGVVEYQNRVFFSYAALQKTVQLTQRYFVEVGSPENALGVLREAAVLARKARGEQTTVTAEDVAKVVHEKTNIPVEAVSASETEKLLTLEQRMHGRVVGQDEAVVALSQAMRRARAELREGKRPIVNVLFLGPTGVGKTELAKTLAAEYFGDEKSMVRLDMSEYQNANAVSRMIGEPGDERGGLLTEAVRRHPFSLVLLDEIEKAHPDILTLFLQVMDDGRLTDGVGRTVDFTNTVLIMTSNAGTPFIQAEVAKGTPTEQIKTALLERELRSMFRPEFLNRFDGVIVFKPLTLDDVTQIAWLLLNGVGKRLEEKGIAFRAEDEAVEHLAAMGYDPLFGARPLRRVIQERVENDLADLLLRKAVGRGDTVVLASDGHLTVEHAPAL